MLYITMTHHGFNRDTSINILIIVSLIFFIGMTVFLVGTFILTDVIHYASPTDIALTVGVFGGWIAFIIAVLVKAVSIYRKLPKGDIMIREEESESDHKSRAGF